MQDKWSIEVMEIDSVCGPEAISVLQSEMSARKLFKHISKIKVSIIL